MSITYRKDLDRVLSAEEVDNNFLELETKSNELEGKKIAFAGSFPERKNIVLSDGVASILNGWLTSLKSDNCIVGNSRSSSLLGRAFPNNEDINFDDVNFSFCSSDLSKLSKINSSIAVVGQSQIDNLAYSLILGANINLDVVDAVDYEALAYSLVMGESISISGDSEQNYMRHSFIFGNNIVLNVASDMHMTVANFLNGTSLNCSHIGCMMHGLEIETKNHSQYLYGIKPLVLENTKFAIGNSAFDGSGDPSNLIEIKDSGVMIISPLTKELITDNKHMTNKEYVDFEDATNLQIAKDYADTQDTTNLQTAKDYADTQDTTNLQTAKDYADTQDTTNLQTAKTYSEGSSGATADRPTTDIYAGSFYFDTDLGKPIWYNGSDWVDYSGTVV